MGKVTEFEEQALGLPEGSSSSKTTVQELNAVSDGGSTGTEFGGPDEIKTDILVTGGAFRKTDLFGNEDISLEDL